MAFVAQYRGLCADCGEWFPAGTEVTYRAEELVHVTCPLGQSLFDKPNAPLCARCYTYHAGECL